MASESSQKNSSYPTYSWGAAGRVNLLPLAHPALSRAPLPAGDHLVPAEVATITDFVDQGGGLLILSEWPYSGNTGNTNIQPVTTLFGITLNGGIASNTSLYFSDFADHPIFEGIDELRMQAAGKLTTNSPASEIAWKNGTDTALIAAAEYGDGRVIALGDSSIFTDDIYGDSRADNRPFSINTIEYLAGPAVPEPSTIVLLLTLGMSLAVGVKAKRRRAVKA